MTNKKLEQIIYLVLVIIWMITVFMFSSQNGEKSQSTSQSITEWIVEILTSKNIEELEKLKLIENLDYAIRKLAHYSIYALGGILIYNYINTYELSKNKLILFSILIGTVYAISDEFHQYFTAGRSAQILDVLIDSFGVITGVTITNKVKKT